MSVHIKHSFAVWCPEQGEAEAEAICIKAFIPRLAAESWLKNCNDENQWTGCGDGLLVHVLGPDGIERRWRVTASLTTVYIATEAT